MEKVLLITYSLASPKRNKERLFRRIIEYGSWARVAPNSYLIYTSDDPEDVRNYLMGVLFQGDTIFVTVANYPSACYGLNDNVTNWIHENQFYQSLAFQKMTPVP